MGRQL